MSQVLTRFFWTAKAFLLLGTSATAMGLGSSKKEFTQNKTQNENQAVIKAEVKDELSRWCKGLEEAAARFKWKVPPCKTENLKVWGHSVKGRPLVYREYGDQSSDNTTLIVSMVHGDENTPLYISLHLLDWLEKNISRFPSTRVVIAPLVNPDGFYRVPKTRVNARGVDVNRNFATSDWEKSAIQKWRKRFASNPRRFPGKKPETEPETIFQKELIHFAKPQKILSIHAPLNFMDYDGPNEQLKLSNFPTDYVKKCLQLRREVNAVSGGFFPGSLGNYAGQEMGVPTLTLELPSARPQHAPKYWKRFREGVETVIGFQVPNVVFKKKGIFLSNQTQ